MVVGRVERLVSLRDDEKVAHLVAALVAALVVV